MLGFRFLTRYVLKANRKVGWEEVLILSAFVRRNSIPCIQMPALTFGPTGFWCCSDRMRTHSPVSNPSTK